MHNQNPSEVLDDLMVQDHVMSFFEIFLEVTDFLVALTVFLPSQSQ